MQAWWKNSAGILLLFGFRRKGSNSFFLFYSFFFFALGGIRKRKKMEEGGGRIPWPYLAYYPVCVPTVTTSEAPSFFFNNTMSERAALEILPTYLLALAYQASDPD